MKPATKRAFSDPATRHGQSAGKGLTVCQSRRSFLFFGTVLCASLISAHSVFGRSISKVYTGVGSLLIQISIDSHHSIQQVVKPNEILRATRLLVMKRLQGHRPDIDVVLHTYGGGFLPAGASSRETLRVLVQITLQEGKDLRPQFDGYVGSVGIQLLRTFRRGAAVHTETELLETVPFLSHRTSESLSSNTSDAIVHSLERYAIPTLIDLGPSQ